MHTIGAIKAFLIFQMFSHFIALHSQLQYIFRGFYVTEKEKVFTCAEVQHLEHKFEVLYVIFISLILYSLKFCATNNLKIIYLIIK